MRKSEEAIVKIDKNIPFPTRRYGVRSKYPWMELNTGDSFVFEGSVATAHAATTYYNSKTGKEFRARAYNGHVRVWRTK